MDKHGRITRQKSARELEEEQFKQEKLGALQTVAADVLPYGVLSHNLDLGADSESGGDDEILQELKAFDLDYSYGPCLGKPH